MKQIFLTLTFLLLIGVSVKSQSCRQLPDKFYSYSQAIQLIKSATFNSTDKLPYGKSSWIISAAYYSCDGSTGYLVYTTDKAMEYIHEKVPIRVWTEFKNASSSGSYYVQNIKGRYRLIPEG
ncbi:MAG: KTSC domain-containing protein [Bacteroidetes bacterium]|nr:KTSC domain-containing protein [Bacteroidota bacterium]